MAYDIFISYSKNDISIASLLSEIIRELGLRCYVDMDELQESSEVQSAILNSEYVIYIYGEDSEESIWQRRELDLALESNKKVISILKGDGSGIICTILKKKTGCIYYTNIADIIDEIKKKILVKKGAGPIEPSCNIYETGGSSVKKSNKIKWVFFVLLILILSYLFSGLFFVESPNSKIKEDLSQRFTQIESIIVNDSELEEDLDELEKSLEKDALELESLNGEIEELVAQLETHKRMETSQKRMVADDDSLMQEMLEDQKIEKQLDSVKSIRLDAENKLEYYNLDDFDIDSSGSYIEQQDSHEYIWSYNFVILFLGVILGVVISRVVKMLSRKKNIKMFSDVDALIFIDNKYKAEICAGGMYSMCLNKGEYLIDFRPKDIEIEHNRMIQKIGDKDTHVIVSDFLNKREIKFKCFIAGSIALSDERDALRSIMAEMYNQWESDNIRISSYTFEDFNRDVIIGGQQKLYDAFIEEDADWVVFIISDGIGEKTLNEYHIAMNSYVKFGHPKILFLAYSESVNDKIVMDIKNEIIMAEQYWNTYYNREHMKSLFYKCVNWDVTLLSKKRKG